MRETSEGNDVKLNLRRAIETAMKELPVWHAVCLAPQWGVELESFPLRVGSGPDCDIVLADARVLHKHFLLDQMKTGELALNPVSPELSPCYLDGVPVTDPVVVDADHAHLIVVGRTLLGLAVSVESAVEIIRKNTDGVLAELDALEQERANVQDAEEDTSGGERRTRYSEEVDPVAGESFRCPFCRTVTPLEDVLSVSVSPTLLGDPILGELEHKRFLPSRFTGTGLAIDAAGGVCTEIACPRCHMALPQVLIEPPQIVMSIIGAPGSGKSVFLASGIWQCRQMLGRRFGVGFRDLDPKANSWINAYEEKLFFQTDDQAYQKIEKTDEAASNVCKSVLLDGDNVLLPLPSFFQLKKEGAEVQSLVVYDSAGEHFRAGADLQNSVVTLNMLNADVLYFMFDPSADPRLRARLNWGGGTAMNNAQRQDVLLSEMAERIRRHLGSRGERKLTRPLIFGVSKADLLADELPLTAPVYRELGSRRYALDVAELRRVSDATERLLADAVPEVVETAHDIAENVWFIPVSALGHNPMKDEGVRPCDIRPIWAELPFVMTLARRGLVETVDGTF